VGRISAALALAVVTMAPRAPHAQALTLSTMEVLDQYDRHRELALDALSRIEHVGTIEDALEADGDAWVNALGPNEAPRRRLVAATFALEAARVGLDDEWKISAYLVDWGCRELRKQKVALPEERLWQRAALALIEGARDFEFLGYPMMEGTSPPGHLDHLKGRLPDNDPGLIMARAFQATAPRVLMIPRSLGDGSMNLVPSATVHALEVALTVPSLAAEAHVRLAYLDLMGNRFDTAFAHLDSAAALPADRDIRYLSALFRGWACMRDHKPDDAMAAYRRAVQIVPGAQTATLALGAALYAKGDREEASTLVDQMFATPVQDPWLLYGYGDFRLFPQLMADLREVLK
jgi:tetratricopeptide (TPR) repeat protein